MRIEFSDRETHTKFLVNSKQYVGAINFCVELHTLVN
jgi:hypothetical protein